MSANFKKQFHVSQKFITACTHKCIVLKENPIALRKYKCDELNSSQNNLTLFIKGVDGNVCDASHKVSFHIAHCREVHTIAKNSDHILCIR
jgi:hypothetical protein